MFIQRRLYKPDSATAKDRLGCVKVSKLSLLDIVTLLSLSLSLSPRQSEGTLLATGSYDGFARIWTKDGERTLIH